MKYIIIGFFLILAGCSSTANLITDDYKGPEIEKSDFAAIKVYSIAPSNLNYTTLGSVVASADAGSNAKKSVKMLKKQAAKLGANAIIDLKLEVDMGYWSNAIKATGVAVIIK